MGGGRRGPGRVSLCNSHHPAGPTLNVDGSEQFSSSRLKQCKGALRGRRVGNEGQGKAPQRPSRLRLGVRLGLNPSTAPGDCQTVLASRKGVGFGMSICVW